MKLVIDTTAKTVKLEDSANVSELVDALKKMFPEDWKSYKIEQSVVFHSYPVYPYGNWYYGYNQPSVYVANRGTGCVAGGNHLVTSFTFGAN